MKANPIDRGQAMISDRTVAVLRNHFGDRLSYDDWWFVGEQIRAALSTPMSVTDAMVDEEIERRIDALGWPEIHAFQDTLRGGQDVYEDAGGFMVRAFKALLGIRRDPVLTYRQAVKAAMQSAHTEGEG